VAALRRTAPSRQPRGAHATASAEVAPRHLARTVAGAKSPTSTAVISPAP
jgi:hypothetical protein